MSKGFQSPGGRASTDSAAQSAISPCRRQARVVTLAKPASAGSGVFVCAAEPYAEGKVTGARLARELLTKLRHCPAGSEVERHRAILLARDALRDACTLLVPCGGQGPSTNFAAYTFMGIMAEALFLFAKKADIEQYTALRLREAEASAALWNEHLSKERQAFVQRMAEAKARKRVQQAQGATA